MIHHLATDLQAFALPSVRATGRVIGTGAYGSVEAVEIPGAVCAAKRIHTALQDRSSIPAAEIRRSEAQFVNDICRAPAGALQISSGRDTQIGGTVREGVSADEHAPPPPHRPVPGSVRSV